MKELNQSASENGIEDMSLDDINSEIARKRKEFNIK